METAGDEVEGGMGGGGTGKDECCRGWITRGTLPDREAGGGVEACQAERRQRGQCTRSPDYDDPQPGRWISVPEAAQREGLVSLGWSHVRRVETAAAVASIARGVYSAPLRLLPKPRLKIVYRSLAA